MEYEIIFGKYPNELQDAVNEKIQAGWVPQGGVCCDSFFWQAMIKPDKRRTLEDIIGEKHHRPEEVLKDLVDGPEPRIMQQYGDHRDTFI